MVVDKKNKIEGTQFGKKKKKGYSIWRKSWSRGLINWAQFFLGEEYFQSCILFASFFNFPIVQWTKSMFKIRHLLGLVIMLIGSITSHIIWTHDPPAASYTHTGMSNSLRPKVTKTFQRHIVTIPKDIQKQKAGEKAIYLIHVSIHMYI